MKTPIPASDRSHPRLRARLGATLLALLLGAAAVPAQQQVVLDASDGLDGPISLDATSSTTPFNYLEVSSYRNGSVVRLSLADGVVTKPVVSSDGISQPWRLAPGPYVPGVFTDNVLLGSTQLLDASDGLDGPIAVVRGPDGSLYVACRDGDNVLKRAPDGTVTELIDATGDGAGAVLDHPYDVALGADGSVYVCGWLSHNAFRVAPDGTITEIVDVNGAGGSELLINPTSVVVDPAGRVYVAGWWSNNVLRVDPDGTVTKVLGIQGDGTNSFAFPTDLDVDVHGNVVACGETSNNVMLLDTLGGVSQIMSGLSRPMGVAFGPDGVVYATSYNSDEVHAVGPLPLLLPWQDLGGASTIVPTPPRLETYGAASVGAEVVQHLSDAPPAALAIEWAAALPSSLTSPVPAFGGLVYAVPKLVQVPIAVDTTGNSVVELTWPPGLPSGTWVILQTFVADPSAPGGVTVSNAVRTRTP